MGVSALTHVAFSSFFMFGERVGLHIHLPNLYLVKWLTFVLDKTLTRVQILVLVIATVVSTSSV